LHLYTFFVFVFGLIHSMALTSAYKDYVSVITSLTCNHLNSFQSQLCIQKGCLASTYLRLVSYLLLVCFADKKILRSTLASLYVQYYKILSTMFTVYATTYG
jgi:hypothetical protein